MTDNLKTARTLIGGSVDVDTRVHRDVLLGALDVVTLYHEDGEMEFTEDEATNLIGALTTQLVENRRRRAREVLADQRAKDECDLAYVDSRACPRGADCRYRA